MCLVLMAYKVHPVYPFIFAANRDEFYDRPSQTADFWEENPDILAGRDLRGGGTWLGMTRQGRFAALTNFRDPSSLMTNAPSRGELVRRFLDGKDRPEDYWAHLEENGRRYNGFNLLFGRPDALFCYSNRHGGGLIEPGVHGLSNATLDVPWPKVERGKEKLTKLLKSKRSLRQKDLFTLLTDRSKPADSLLPRTGVDLEWERVLSSMFISSPVYGTRSSTVILVDRRGKVSFEERSFIGPEPWMAAKFDYVLGGAV